MEERHRDAIQKNFSSLVEQTDIDVLVPQLLEKGVFSLQMIDPYTDIMNDKRSRKRQLYRDIERRGPLAFGKLIEALTETGHWDLVKMLDADHALHGQMPLISLRDNRRENKPVKSHDPNIGHSAIPVITNNLEKTAIYTPHISPEKNEANLLQVTKSTKFMDTDDDTLLCYSTESKKRGVLFMINNVNFEHNHEEPREGAMNDQRNVENLFKQIGFHKLLIHTDLTAMQMQSAIKSFAKSDDIKRTDCVFIVIASHGHNREHSIETDIRGTDGKTITTHSILEQFNNENCENLQNIPKVFIFQMCRGSNQDQGPFTESIIRPPKVQIDGRMRSKNTSLRIYSDMLIAHSTIPGFVSHRDTEKGSWYFQALCEIFAEHCHCRHVEDLFKMVDAKLRDNQQTSKQTSSVDNWGFNKYLYLHPGLFNAPKNVNSANVSKLQNVA